MKDCEAHIYIKQGRHPVLDSCLPENEQYVPNDTHVNVSESSYYSCHVCTYCSTFKQIYKVSTGRGTIIQGQEKIREFYFRL